MWIYKYEIRKKNFENILVKKYYFKECINKFSNDASTGREKIIGDLCIYYNNMLFFEYENLMFIHTKLKHKNGPKGYPFIIINMFNYKNWLWYDPFTNTIRENRKCRYKIDLNNNTICTNKTVLYYERLGDLLYDYGYRVKDIRYFWCNIKRSLFNKKKTFRDIKMSFS